MLDRFLYHDAVERERLLDLSLRLRRTHLLTIAVMLAPLLVGIPTFGWGWAAPLIISGAIQVVTVPFLPRVRRPEAILFSNAVIGIAAALLGIALARGPIEYLLATPVFPVLLMAPIFGRRVAVTTALVAGAALTVVAIATDGGQVRAMPPILILPLLLMFVTVLSSVASRNAESINRSTAVVDPLTGLLNRAALQARATELELHTAASGDRVGLLIADVDHFKSINDARGHAIGDRVLTELARRMRTELGNAGTLFRFGGEEFVVILQSTSSGMAVEWAERLREAIRFAPIEGEAVTASFGVAVSETAGFKYHERFMEADDALYRAKAAGRDRVWVASELIALDPAAPSGTGTAGSVRRATDLPAGHAAPALATAGDPIDGSWNPLGRRDHEGNWLVADAIERAHVIDLLERSAKDSAVNSLVLLSGLIVCGFWLEWWYLIPPILASIAWMACTTIVPKLRRPEFPALGGIVLMSVSTTVSTMLTHPGVIFGLPMAALAVFGACAGIPRLGAFTVGATAMASTALAAFVVDPGAVSATPFALVFPLALIASGALLGETVGRSARQHRVASITDGLTGALNRAALEARIPQLSQHVAGSTAPITLLVADIDHFKRVNDDLGHDTGDAVLRDVANRMRGSLRSFDSVYRVGGEEFVVVLTDTSELDALVIAERMRAAVGATPSAGATVTISIGLATAGAGAGFDYDATFAVADHRLYAAKEAGRNRIVAADPPPPALRLVAA